MHTPKSNFTNRNLSHLHSQFIFSTPVSETKRSTSSSVSQLSRPGSLKYLYGRDSEEISDYSPVHSIHSEVRKFEENKADLFMKLCNHFLSWKSFYSLLVLSILLSYVILPVTMHFNNKATSIKFSDLEDQVEIEKMFLGKIESQLKMIQSLMKKVSSLRKELQKDKEENQRNLQMVSEKFSEQQAKQFAEFTTNLNENGNSKVSQILWSGINRKIEDEQKNLLNKVWRNQEESFEKLRKDIKNEIKELSEKEESKYNKQIQTSMANFGHRQISRIENNLKSFVLELDRKDDTDKTKMADYALESAGGLVHAINCTPVYASSVRLMGFKLFSIPSQANKIIQPSVQPSECWAFGGSSAEITLRLYKPIYIRGFSLEHIPKELSPDENLTSAPKGFSIYGLPGASNKTAHLLGIFHYDKYERSLQYFPSKIHHNVKFELVKIDFFSNWGNDEYTCVYRFQAHGTPTLSHSNS